MTQAEMLEFINKNPVTFLATVEGNAPRVRAVMILSATEEGILFNTGSTKDLCKQLGANPQVEMCFYDPQSKVKIRVSGSVAGKNDAATRKLVLEKLPFLRPLVEKHGEEILAPFILSSGRATRWEMATGFEPKTYLDF